MAVVRVEKKSNYTTVDNGYLRDCELSLRACGLLTRMLSLPDNWTYSVTGLAKICKDGEDAIRSALRELEKAGYLVRRRFRGENGKLAGMEYVIYEQSVLVNPTQENPQEDYEEQGMPGQGEARQHNTKIRKTKMNNNDPINQDVGMMDRTAQEEAVRNKIDYPALVIRNPHNVDQIDEMVAIMADVMMMPDSAEITVGGNQLSAGAVKSQLCRLGSNHIEYVLDSMLGSAAPIRNIHGYLLTALYRAPLTLHNHYAAQVACDDMTAAEGDITS